MASDTHTHIPRMLSGWRLRWYNVIFEADTVAGKRFDLLLVWAIVISLLVIMLDSVQSIHEAHNEWLGRSSGSSRSCSR